MPVQNSNSLISDCPDLATSYTYINFLIANCVKRAVNSSSIDLKMICRNKICLLPPRMSKLILHRNVGQSKKAFRKLSVQKSGWTGPG